MGNGGCDENAVVDLEAKRSDTFSWHPCLVHLCSAGMGLIVQYGDGSLEEMIADKDKVLERIRVRSTPLQGDDCSSIQEGDHVLASPNLHFNKIFCDAKVKQVIRVRHSKRTHCRCSFIIKWLYKAPGEEESTVPSSEIMKLSTESIDLHPAISAFFKMQGSSNVPDTPPFPTVADTLDLEMDIDFLLDKQIEEISNSTVVSRAKSSQNIIFGHQVDPNEQVSGKEIDDSFKDQFTKHEDEQLMETVLENFPVNSSVQEKFTETRPSLNPLAARAALALIRSNLVHNGLSVESDIERGNITSELSANKLLYGVGSSVSSITVDVSSGMSLTFGGENPKYEGIVKTLFPTPSASSVTSTTQGKGMKKSSSNSENWTHHSEKRLTRGQLRRNNEIVEETQLSCSAKRRKVNCNGTGKMEVDEANTSPEYNVIINFHKMDSSMQKQVASPIDGDSIFAENEKIPLKEDGMITDIDCRKVNVSATVMEINTSQRLTRAAVRRETEKYDAQCKLKLKQGKVSESNVEDVSEGNVAYESSRLKPEKPIFSSASTNTSAHPTKKREKNRETCVTVKKTPASSEHAVSSSQGINRNAFCSKKQERRFSPRLRFLPRTGSEDKG